MKINQRQLRQIIKEAMGRVEEGIGTPPGRLEAKIESDFPDGGGHLANLHSTPSMWKFTAEDGEEYFYAEREDGAGSGSWEQTDAPGEVNEGMTPDQMPDSWRQILGSCLDED